MYACLTSGGHVKPPCTSAHCPSCEHEPRRGGCVFAPPVPAQEQPKRDRHNRKRRYRKGAAERNRKLGLCSRGKPLRHTCFNCVHVRLAEYGRMACAEGILPRPYSRETMIRKERCEVWEVRLTEMEMADECH